MSVDYAALGKTGLRVSAICIGTSPIANFAQLYGHEVDDETAIAMVQHVLNGPINFLDTSNGYGIDGLAERRIGEAIRRNGGLPEGFVLQTKVDPDPTTGDFSLSRVRRSLEESLDRLGIETVPVLALHDPESITPDGFGPGGALEGLVRLRDEGRVDHLAIATGSIAVIHRYLDSGEFDVVLNHSRYTLVDRSAEKLFQRARSEGLGVLNAAPYGGGLLAQRPRGGSKYAYGDAAPVIAERALQMHSACENAGTPLAAAALQFSVRSPLVDSTVIGVSSAQRVDETLDLLDVEVPDELWAELEALTPSPTCWLEGTG